jgi:hypothetical protein
MIPTRTSAMHCWVLIAGLVHRSWQGKQAAQAKRSPLRIRPTRLIPAMTGHLALVDDQPVRTSRDQPTRLLTHTSSWSVAMMFNDLLDRYVDWLESARGVGDAYARWSGASGPDWPVRYAAFSAALDQEQNTAAAYASAVTNVQRELQGSD